MGVTNHLLIGMILQVKDPQLSQFLLRPKSRGAQKAHWDIGYNHGSSTQQKMQRKWEKMARMLDVLMARGGVINNTPGKNEHHNELGGGFKNFLCSSLFGEDDPIWLIFFRWVETTN